MHRIDGKALASRLRQELKSEVETLDHSPKLAILLVGDDPASHLYVSLKQKAAEDIGVRIELAKLPADTSETVLIQKIETWNADPTVDAILVQLPLPPDLDENKIISAMDPRKDADGFHPVNIQALLDGRALVIPPVHIGILRLINEAPVRLNGTHAVILANSSIFAEPLAKLLSTAGMSVEVISPDDLDKDLLQSADVVVSAIGRPKFLDASWIKDGAVIIDVGTTRVEGKTYGDAHIESFEHRDVWVTPVPGGVGPMTIAQLLKNVVDLSRQES